MTYIHMTKDGSEVFLAAEVYGTELYELEEDLKIETRYFIGYMLEHPEDLMNSFVITAEALFKKSVRIGEL